MPMEHIRKRLQDDVNLYPTLPRTSGQRSQPISIASSTSTSSVPPSGPLPKPTVPSAKRGTVILSSDEEDEVVEVVPNGFKKPAAANPPPLQPRFQNMNQPPSFQPGASKDALPRLPQGMKAAGVPIRVPSSKDFPPAYGQRPMAPARPFPSRDGEEVNIPDFRDDNIFMSPADAEKALRELMGGGMNQDSDSNVEVDMEEAIVPGFKDGIVLLPHQVLGRTWMREREDIERKRTGGILADDMGLGKTIQTLTRIVEGKPKKSDKDEGWSGSTLVVCPLALVGQWADEIKKMTGLRVVKHQGPNRTTDPQELQRYHVVVTTYDTVKSEYDMFTPPAKDESKPSKSSKKAAKVSDSDSEAEDFGRPARKVKGKAGTKKYEAHNIKNVKTKGAIACCELQAKFRWCLTGTPMQNNVTELFSLLKFLRVKPLNDWDRFNEQIAKPVNSGRGAGRAMKRLQVVLKQIMLRRRKDQQLNGQVLIKLPKRSVEIISCDFNASERSFYDALETKMEDVIEKLMKNSKGGSNYIGVLTLLLRLRQACNHPILVTKDYKTDVDALEPKAVPKGKDDTDADADDLAAAFGQMGVSKKCLMCTIELNSDNIGAADWNTHCQGCIPMAIEAKRAERERPSSAKIRMVLKLLSDIDDRSNSEEKTIIFSQFTTMLDLLGPFLSEMGIKYVRYDGSMSPKDREAALEKIKTSTTTRVILISFKAGSTGLNLTACNNVILVDLWWNPALEDQAFDRAHRFGQQRDVNIFKLKIDNTVEDRILVLQDKKRALAAAALSGDKIKDMRLGMEDLLALFRPGGRDDDDDDDDD